MRPAVAAQTGVALLPPKREPRERRAREVVHPHVVAATLPTITTRGRLARSGDIEDRVTSAVPVGRSIAGVTVALQVGPDRVEPERPSGSPGHDRPASRRPRTRSATRPSSCRLIPPARPRRAGPVDLRGRCRRQSARRRRPCARTTSSKPRRARGAAMRAPALGSCLAAPGRQVDASIGASRRQSSGLLNRPSVKRMPCPPAKHVRPPVRCASPGSSVVDTSDAAAAGRHLGQAATGCGERSGALSSRHAGRARRSQA